MILAVVLGFGCTREKYILDIPLANGNVWYYKTTINYKAMGKENTLPAPDYRLSVENAVEEGLYVFLLQGDSSSGYSVTVKKDEQGIREINNLSFLLKRKVCKNQCWKARIWDTQFNIKVKGKEEISLETIGKRKAVRIDFIAKDKDKKGSGSLWITPEIGILSIYYISQGQGVKAETRLILCNYKIKGK